MNPFDLHHVTRAVANTRFSGKLTHFATIDSTNIRAVEAANAGAEDGTVYVADEQTAAEAEAAIPGTPPQGTGST